MTPGGLGDSGDRPWLIFVPPEAIHGDFKDYDSVSVRTLEEPSLVGYGKIIGANEETGLVGIAIYRETLRLVDKDGNFIANMGA